MEKRTIILNQVEDIKKVIRIMMAESDINSMAELARNLDMKETTFRSAVSRGSLRISDFMKLSDMLGYEVILRDKINV